MRTIQFYQLTLQYVDKDGHLNRVASSTKVHTWDFKDTTFAIDHPVKSEALEECVQDGIDILVDPFNVGGKPFTFGRVIGYVVVLGDFMAV